MLQFLYAPYLRALERHVPKVRLHAEYLEVSPLLYHRMKIPLTSETTEASSRSQRWCHTRSMHFFRTWDRILGSKTLKFYKNEVQTADTAKYLYLPTGNHLIGQ